ncbi:hypothetical protein NEUTE2DRAFT_64596, partial [Neurospora tetrasperma FGSC 2509]
YINNILSNYLNNFTLIYINNILIFLFRLKKNYLTKVYKVVERLIIIKLYLDLKKYKFIIKSVKYFGFIIIINVNI